MFFSRPEPTLIAEADALPGRSEPTPVADAHLVLGTPMIPPFPDHLEQVVLGMGCFWGAERIFWNLDGVHTTAVGYAGGFTPNASYEEVCSGRTGHTEAALVVFDPSVVTLDTILGQFWENHDPTTMNRQGNDVGTQYRSAIYTSNDAQAEIALASAEKYAAKLAEMGFGEVTTEITPAGAFYYGEDYHQQYLEKNPRGYCNHGFCQVSYA